MIILEKFQKHIVLYCKGQYNIPEGEKGFFEGLKMIWAIRCGYDYKYTSKDTLTYIANDMFNIIMQCRIEKVELTMRNIHKGINDCTKPKNLTPIEALIWEYKSILSYIQVKEIPKGKKRYQWIINIDNSQPGLFNRILRGNGKYDDYKKVI